MISIGPDQPWSGLLAVGPTHDGICCNRVDRRRCSAGVCGPKESLGPASHFDLAKAEAINESYLGRVLRLTLLSPSIIEAILEGLQPANLELDGLFKQFPVAWDQQLETLTKG